MVLDCFEELRSTELDDIGRILSSLVIFYDEMTDPNDLFDVFGDDYQEAVEKMFLFFNCGQPEFGNRTNYVLVDWEKDAQLIAGAINNVAGKEIRALEYLHWWTFLGYYAEINHSAWNSIVAIRYKMKAGKSLEKEEARFKRENPQYFVWDSSTLEDKKANEWLNNILDRGG